MIKLGRVSGGSSLSSAASRSFLPTAQARNVLSHRGFVFHVGWWSLRWGKRGPPRQICKGQVIISNERQTGIFSMTLSLLNLPPVLNMNDLLQFSPVSLQVWLLVPARGMFLNPRICSQTVLPLIPRYPEMLC